MLFRASKSLKLTSLRARRDRDHLISNLVGHMKAAKKELQKRQTAIFYKVDPDYGTRVANGLGLDIAEIKKIAEK